MRQICLDKHLGHLHLVRTKNNVQKITKFALNWTLKLSCQKKKSSNCTHLYHTYNKCYFHTERISLVFCKVEACNCNYGYSFDKGFVKLESYAGYLPTQRQVKETQQIGNTSRSTAKTAQSTVLVQAELEKHK